MKKTVKVVDSFTGEYRFLSNFYPCDVEFDGVTYPSVEHAYQAAKTLRKSDRERIKKAGTASEAKRIGGGVELRRDWNQIRVGVMEELVAAKFSKPVLRQMLLATGDDELVEGNRWGDTFWGVCNGRGKNLLGKMLMDIRSETRKG